MKQSLFTLVAVTGILAFCAGLILANIISRNDKPSVNQSLQTQQETAELKSTHTQSALPVKDTIQVSPTRTPGKRVTAIRTISKGFEFKSNVDFPEGGLASAERKTKESYLAEYNLTINSPKPAISMEEVTASAPDLETSLAALPTLLANADVNPYWHELYKRKKKTVVNDAHYLNELITKHNFYDCQTMLNLRHPDTKRRALLVQADMDVVTDGSDGDRMPSMPEEITTATYYQPTTSYSWAKTSDRPNPMIAGYETRIENADRELRKSGTTADRASWLKQRKKELRGTIGEMKQRSFLIAEHDPFIVLPVPVIVAKDSYSPNVGDYTIVFHKGKAYPAIVGDAGPSYKMGEASLRIASHIDQRSGSLYRPVSDLSVSYLVFPGTRKQPNHAPDYGLIHTECQRLIDELGGLGQGIELHTWENTLPPIIEEVEEPVAIDVEQPIHDPAFPLPPEVEINE